MSARRCLRRDAESSAACLRQSAVTRREMVIQRVSYAADATAMMRCERAPDEAAMSDVTR